MCFVALALRSRYCHGWHWPAFNMPDVAITFGARLVLIFVILTGRKNRTANV